jgi:hypothetical protein
VFVLRGGEFTAPLSAAAISADGRWLRVRSADLTPLSSGVAAPEEPMVAVSTAAYGRSWAAIAGGTIVPTAEQAVERIRNAAPAMELAQRLLAGLQPAQVPAAAPAAGDLDDDD